MEFPDLSQYSYYQPKPFADVFNVGWIGKGKPFAVGPTPVEFLDKLKSLMRAESHIKMAVNRIRSVHPCNICGEREFAALGAGDEIPIGAAEIWIPRLDDGFFAAPSMILHYVADHDYLPPQSFIDSVLAMDSEQVVDAQSEYANRAALAMK